MTRSIELFERNLDLVDDMLARMPEARYYRHSQDRDDMHQEGLIGLWQAAERWDGRGTFRGWASVRVRGAMRDWSRRQHPRGVAAARRKEPVLMCVSLDRTFREDGEPMIASLASTHDVETEATAHIIFDELPDKERFLVAARLSGYVGSEIASVWGVTEQAVSARKIRLARRLLGEC